MAENRFWCSLLRGPLFWPHSQRKWMLCKENHPHTRVQFRNLEFPLFCGLCMYIFNIFIIFIVYIYIYCIYIIVIYIYYYNLLFANPLAVHTQRIHWIHDPCGVFEADCSTIDIKSGKLISQTLKLPCYHNWIVLDFGDIWITNHFKNI